MHYVKNMLSWDKDKQSLCEDADKKIPQNNKNKGNFMDTRKWSPLGETGSLVDGWKMEPPIHKVLNCNFLKNRNNSI